MLTGTREHVEALREEVAAVIAEYERYADIGIAKFSGAA